MGAIQEYCFAIPRAVCQETEPQTQECTAIHGAVSSGGKVGGSTQALGPVDWLGGRGHVSSMAVFKHNHRTQVGLDELFDTP